MTRRVAIVGAGVVGLACATYLRMQGDEVVLVDPLPPGEHCSLGNAGCFSRASFVPLVLPGAWKKVPGWLLDPLGPLSIPIGYLPRLLPWLWGLQRSSAMSRVDPIADAMRELLSPTLDFWDEIAGRAGAPELVLRRGWAMAYHSREGYLGDEAGREIRRRRGVTMEVLEGKAVRDFEPALSESVTHLVNFPEQGHTPDPLGLSRALARRLAADGASFISRSVTGFEVHGGHVKSLLTDGDPIEADAFVIAAGAKSHRLTAHLGSRVPLETERGYHVMLAEPSVAPRLPIVSGEGKFVATAMSGGLRIAGTVELAGLDAPPDYRRADALLEKGKHLLADLRHGKVERWMGHRPSLPDSKPVIGRSPHFPNAYFAFGHGHVGLTAAAPTGKIIAALIDGRMPFMDPAPFSAARFS